MQLTTQVTIHVINWSPCRPSAPGSIFTPGCSAVASSGITIVLGYGGPHGPPYGTWRPIRIGSSVALTKNIFSTKPTEDGPKKCIKFWPLGVIDRDSFYRNLFYFTQSSSYSLELWVTAGCTYPYLIWQPAKWSDHSIPGYEQFMMRFFSPKNSIGNMFPSLGIARHLAGLGLRKPIFQPKRGFKYPRFEYLKLWNPLQRPYPRFKVQ